MRWFGVLLLQACLSQAATYVIAAGVEQYDDAQISRLSYAVADARSVAAAFRASGVPPKHVVLLTSDVKDAAKRPSRINLLRAFGAVKAQAKVDDKLVFFFAGHGVERNGEHYLLGSDTQRDLLEETALPMGVVNKALEGLACGEVLFLIDACRNDPTAGRGDADAELSEEFARGLRPKFTGPTAKPRFVATLLACDAGQRAWEAPENGHGAFSMYLVKALSGQGAGADGQVTLSALAEYVGKEVSSWASRSKREQRPRLINPDGGDMVILTAPPEPVVSVAFQNHTLAQVVDLLAEQFSAQIVLGPGADATVMVTGRLDNRPLGTVLRVLVAAHGLTVRREGKVYLIEGDPLTARPTKVAPPPAAVRPDNWPEYLARFEPPEGLDWSRFRVRAADDMPQVYISPGETTIGFSVDDAEAALAGRELDLSEKLLPSRRIALRGYWMDMHEVTNQQYVAFLESRGAGDEARSRWLRVEGEDLPISVPYYGVARVGAAWELVRARELLPVAATWAGAAAYAEWVDATLPSEAQWEHAARAGNPGLIWQWGNHTANAGRVANVADLDLKKARPDFGAWFSDTSDGFVYLSPACSLAPNGFGVFDLAGNAWEWCVDVFRGDWYQEMPDVDPVCSRDGTRHTVRGACWGSSPITCVLSTRFGFDAADVAGFRCVQPATP